MQRSSVVQTDGGPATKNVIRHRGRWGDIDSPSLLRLWAKEAAIKKLWLGTTVRALQEDPAKAPAFVEGVLTKLRRTLHDPDAFDGTPEARRDAVEALNMVWAEGRVPAEILDDLTTRYSRQLIQAHAHTPPGSELVTAPKDFLRIRKQPYLQEFWNGGEVMKKGYTSGNREVLDIKSYVPAKASGIKPSVDPTADIWYILKRDWSWIYHTTGNANPYDWYIGKFAGETAENTQLAAELFPLMLKIGGFSLGLSSRLTWIIVGEVITALGEQGTRSARGQQMQSPLEVLKGIGFGVFVGGVTNRIFGRTDAGNLADLDEVAERAAKKGRDEVARTDADLIKDQLTAGRAQPVTDASLSAQGYRLEVHVVSEGQPHIWRMNRRGGWCRFSEPICVTGVSDEVAEAARGAGATGAGGATTAPRAKRFAREFDINPALKEELTTVEKMAAGPQRAAAEAALDKKLAELQKYNDDYLDLVREEARTLRARAMTDPKAVDEMKRLYKEQPGWVLEALKTAEDAEVQALKSQRVKPALRESRRDPVLAEELARKRGEAELKKLVASDYRMPHEADVLVTDQVGTRIDQRHFVSGGVTPEDVAQYGFREANARSHTEAKALAEMELQQGQKMTIVGQFDPCRSCQARMRAAAQRSGATITYYWMGGPRTGVRFGR